jgi:hypothetical protein
MSPAPHESAVSNSVHAAKPTLSCSRCGRFDAREIGDTVLCDDCYSEAGACCAADDDDSCSSSHRE